jgi:ferrochelatase
MISKKAALLIGFGGPRSVEETRPFLEYVLQGVRIPKERFEEVLHHYEVIGGVSPYIEYTEKQQSALKKRLQSENISIPVFTGYRNSKPFFKDVFLELKQQGIEKVIGFVLSPLRSYASFGKYVDRVEEGKKEADALDIEIVYTEPFYLNLLFVEAQADRIKDAASQISKEELQKTFFIFSAHSIPVSAASDSRYAEEFFETASLICKKLEIKNWTIAYQSRSGRPSDPWLEPSVEEAMEQIDSSAFKNVLVVPSGFLCDNVEVLFDLDIQAKEKAVSLGLNYFRAKTVMDHPKFIEMLAHLVKEKL